jgi:hypothetical protein
MKAQQLWNKILATLKDEVNPQIFNSWFGNSADIQLLVREPDASGVG